MASLSEANAKFCFDFFKEVQKSKRNENIFFSPLSISSAMAMVLLGARGNTAKQMEKVLHFDEVSSSSGGSTKHGSSECEETGEVHSQFQALLSAINKPSTHFSLSVANRLYGAKGFHFLEVSCNGVHASNEFSTITVYPGAAELLINTCTETLYHAELETVDFSNALEETRKKINTWVEEQTSGNIEELFAEGILSSATVLVLVNAIYFKGKWTSEFNKDDTKEDLSGNQTKNVQMMFQNGYCNLAIIEEPEIQLDSALTYTKFVEWTTMTKMHKQNVNVYLPRFKIQESYDLGKTLQAMGMLDLFDTSKADLSGMNGNRDLAVSKAIHKSYVDVNEEGTEAAAATGVEIIYTSPGMPYEFKADHPFLYLIKKNVTNSVLFYGQCTSP
ncbi:serpin B3-like [Alligator mississippiensis]|uniref:serpin B3-like n=1 Tax=Alligator mississippiensis TaxID=8496 RepID=UPI002877416C|nr:serpin B3-like [Alligator mississippiensis]